VARYLASALRFHPRELEDSQATVEGEEYSLGHSRSREAQREEQHGDGFYREKRHFSRLRKHGVDELRRDIDVAQLVQKMDDLSFEVMHDQTVVTPKELQGGSGPIKVFTPYHKAWLAETKSNPELFDTVPAPEANDKKATQELNKLFDSEVPELPESKQFASEQERKRLRNMWPAGHDAGMQRLQHFLDKKVCHV
jgi:deoxyribodipyrimidine photolyase